MYFDRRADCAQGLEPLFRRSLSCKHYACITNLSLTLVTDLPLHHCFHPGGKGNDYWSGWNIAASLLSYADAMMPGDPMIDRCNSAVLRYIQVVYTRMKVRHTH